MHHFKYNFFLLDTLNFREHAAYICCYIAKLINQEGH